MSKIELVPLQYAAEKLEVEDSALVVSKKYKEFYIKSDSNKRNAMFNLKGYLQVYRYTS